MGDEKRRRERPKEGEKEGGRARCDNAENIVLCLVSFPLLSARFVLRFPLENREAELSSVESAAVGSALFNALNQHGNIELSLPPGISSRFVRC